MKQEFYDASGEKTGDTNDGSIMARVKALEAKIRQLTGVKDPGPAKPAKGAKPTPKANPAGSKKFADKKINPDTGELAEPGEPTVKYDASRGSGPSYHFDGASAGGPAGGPMPLGVPVKMPPKTVGPHLHIPEEMASPAPSRMTQSVAANPGSTVRDVHKP